MSDPKPLYIYLVLITQGTERVFEEIEAPDIDTAATVSGGIVVAIRGQIRPRP